MLQVRHDLCTGSRRDALCISLADPVRANGADQAAGVVAQEKLATEKATAFEDLVVAIRKDHPGRHYSVRAIRSFMISLVPP